jgi:hypothetical protein
MWMRPLLSKNAITICFVLLAWTLTWQACLDLVNGLLFYLKPLKADHRLSHCPNVVQHRLGAAFDDGLATCY